MKTLLLVLLFVLPAISNAQITQQQARPIDSILIIEYLDEGEFHTTNYHGVTFPPGGYWTWDAGCGLYFAIDDYFLAWSHTGMVADTLAECLDTMPAQAYHLFNLDNMVNTDAYHDSVELWLGSLGIPVGINAIHKGTVKVWPNPFTDLINVRLPEGSNFVLTIKTINGDVVYKQSEFAQNGQTHTIKLSGINMGLYILTISHGNKVFVKRMIHL